MKHARNSASSAARWLACPGSIKLSEKYPTPPTSEYAEEGTVAHELAERLLKEYYYGEPAGDIRAIRGTEVTDEMAEYVQTYISAVGGLISPEENASGIKKLLIEDKFSLEWLHPEMFGTNDAMVYCPYQKKIWILDLKYGYGIVEPEWNQQLMFYGLGALYRLWSELSPNTANMTDFVTDIELVVAQPRAPHMKGPVRSWSLKTSDLMFWGLNVLKPGAIETTKEGARLTAGKHCKFCPALATCPKRIEDSCALAKTEFHRPVFPSPETMTASDLSKVMEASELFKNWAESVTKFAQEKMYQGMKIPGFKLVGRRTKRKWTDDNFAMNHLFPVLGERCFKKSIITVAQAEKQLKLHGYSPEASLNGTWYKPEAGVTIAVESDGRKEVAPTAQTDFLDMADFLQ